MKRRPNNQKIPDIKVTRQLTRLLGKCGVPSLSRTFTDTEYWHDPDGNMVTQHLTKTIYGWGLKETKDYVESKYDYYLPANETELDRLRGQNIIHEIKRTRQFMSLLRKCGIQSADTGLAVCKAFVTRQRN